MKLDAPSSIPAFCIKNKDVIRMNAAQPFILIVVQIGRTNLETLLSTLRLSSADAIVTGRVPADDFEKSATAKAGSIPLAILNGFKPLSKRIAGRIMNICRRFDEITTPKYCAIPPSITPASSCDTSCDVNARIPIGKIAISQ